MEGEPRKEWEENPVKSSHHNEATGSSKHSITDEMVAPKCIKERFMEGGVQGKRGTVGTTIYKVVEMNNETTLMER